MIEDIIKKIIAGKIWSGILKGIPNEIN